MGEIAKRDEFAEKALWRRLEGLREVYPELKELRYFIDAHLFPSVTLTLSSHGKTIFAEISVDEATDTAEKAREAVEDALSLTSTIRENHLEEEPTLALLKKQMELRYTLEGGHPSAFFKIPAEAAVKELLNKAGSWEAALDALEEHGATDLYENADDSNWKNFIQMAKEFLQEN